MSSKEKTELLKRSEKIDLLIQYSTFLEEHGYTDCDWRAEEPYAIDEFLGEKEHSDPPGGVLVEKMDIDSDEFKEFQKTVLKKAKDMPLVDGAKNAHTEKEWKDLREKYFSECVDKVGQFPKINIAPHDLFEWFKSRLN